ncbi:MAG: helix-turn-helix transcriptional regulator [Lachnospiraceae bacterium]|nr:helix-turn-helix transcriptional regulator [Lachnospiraceae bacterium]MDE7176436.1 helix-turn-helix transcriptional regulator [Lachnospiraceae bacterium]
MKRRALRFFLGVGYVLLLTAMLLYQAGAFGGRRNWAFASLCTLSLGVALAVVLALYVRVNDQIRKDGGKIRQEEQKKAGTGVVETNGMGNRNYEEIYADFLHTCEDRGLSERELEVAWLLYRGHTNRQIGEELFIAETTVKKHVSHIYEKMDVCSRKEFRGKVQTDAFLNGCLDEKK